MDAEDVRCQPRAPLKRVRYNEPEVNNAPWAENVVLQPITGQTKNSRGAALAFHGETGMASIAGVHDYVYAQPTREDFLLGLPTRAHRLMIYSLRDHRYTHTVTTQLHHAGTYKPLPDRDMTVMSATLNPCPNSPA